MAQKAAKTLAARNTAALNRTHLVTLGAHGLFIVFRLLLRFHVPGRASIVAYCLLSAPALLLEVWLERIGRPSYGPPPAKELRRSGEDLEAKGLTEWMWDAIYWTQGCVVLSALLGDWAWWLWGAVPIYTVWLAYSTFSGARRGFAGLGSQDSETSSSTSKRQQKLEKRGGRAQYR